MLKPRGFGNKCYTYDDINGTIILTASFLCTEQRLLFAFLEGWDVSHIHVMYSEGWLAPE